MNLVIKKSILQQKKNGSLCIEIYRNLMEVFKPFPSLQQIRNFVFNYKRFLIKNQGFQFDKRKIPKLTTTCKILIRVINQNF